MPSDDEVIEQLRRYEAVHWPYDGLKGKIIEWTLENGGTSHDPSVQAFILKADGEVVSRAPDGQVYQPGTFARWLDSQANEYERRYPQTRIPLLRCEVVEQDGEVTCSVLDEARGARRPALLYFGRVERKDQTRAAKKEVKAARKFERSTLDSKKAAEAAEGWVLLRFDLADALQARLARGLGVVKAPALVMVLPAEEAPRVLAPRTSGASLAYQLKKATE